MNLNRDRIKVSPTEYHSNYDSRIAVTLCAVILISTLVLAKAGQVNRPRNGSAPSGTGPLSLPLSRSRSSSESTSAYYRRLALFHAPVNFQDTEVRGNTQDEVNIASADSPIQRRGDFMVRFDFDSDWNGLNNWANFARRPPAARDRDTMSRAYMYYSVVETATHYFISYCSYHAQDREPRCVDSECHENDLEGGLHLVRKGPENGGMGTLWLMTYLAHDNWFTYLTPQGRSAGVRLGGRPPHETPQKAQHYNSDFIHDVVWRGITPDGKLFVPRDPHSPSDQSAPKGTVFRPTTWQEPWGHGMYGWPGPDSQSPYDRYRKPDYKWVDGFINGDGIVYYPAERAGIPDYSREVDQVPYSLIDFFEPGGVWDRRENIDRNANGCGGGESGKPDCTWGYFGAFRGERWGTDKANAPWRWDHIDDTIPAGLHAFDPLRLIEEYNDLTRVREADLNHDYLNNRYIGIPEGTRPSRPLPIARTSSRFIAVEPGESLSLDGAGSASGDLEGRGHLLYRWSSDSKDFAATGWGGPTVNSSLKREGIYRVTLTVNDGDHSASADTEIAVASNKIFFDDFQSSFLQPAWRVTGLTWRLGGGLLTARRPGEGLNFAALIDRDYPSNLTIQTRARLDLLYPEAKVPFGLGLAFTDPAEGAFKLLFGFIGTRRIETRLNPSVHHLSEVGFYELRGPRRLKLGPSVMTYPKNSKDGYALGRWYWMKLQISGGRLLRAKIWNEGSSEPDWIYELDLGRQIRSNPVPILTAGAGTSGEITFDHVLVMKD